MPNRKQEKSCIVFQSYADQILGKRSKAPVIFSPTAQNLNRRPKTAICRSCLLSRLRNWPYAFSLLAFTTSLRSELREPSDRANSGTGDYLAIIRAENNCASEDKRWTAKSPRKRRTPFLLGFSGFSLVAKAGIEPATHGFSVRCSTN